MANDHITPHKITKPIQLLGAWLAGLAIINGSFLAGAATINSVEWIPALLAIAAVLNVPLFLASLFLLQTKFRPEMQEDSFYSKYLENKYSTPKDTPKPTIDLEKQFRDLAAEITNKIASGTPPKTEKVLEIIRDSELASLVERFGLSRSLSELHLHKDKWDELVDSFGDDPFFLEDIEELIGAGLVKTTRRNYRTAELTYIGSKVAKRQEEKGKLWNQTHERFLLDLRVQDMLKRKATKASSESGS